MVSFGGVGLPLYGVTRRQPLASGRTPYGDATSTKPDLSEFTGSPPCWAYPWWRDPPRPIPTAAPAFGIAANPVAEPLSTS